MKYTKFLISNYRAIKDPLEIKLAFRLIPLVGANECGKTTILHAIFCFDHHNDNENAGRHFANLDNLYETTSAGVPIVSAVIDCNKADINKRLDSIISDLKKEKDDSTKPVSETEQEGFIKRIENMETLKKTLPDLRNIEISRDLTSKNYECSVFASLGPTDENLICRNIITYMPYILYNDDFNDRPVDTIELTAKEKDDWYDIYNRVFMATNSEYSLEKLLTESELRRKSIIDDVEKHLSNTLTKYGQNLRQSG